jgi:hypothetical protein
LSQCNAADEVHPEGTLYGVETTSRGRAVNLSDHAGVVDANVQLAEIGIDILAAVAVVAGSSMSMER